MLILSGCTGEAGTRAVSPAETGDENIVAEESPVDTGVPTASEPDEVESAPAETPQAGAIREAAVPVDGEPQQYVVYVPADMPSDPAPLVVLLHGPTMPSATVLEAELAKTGLAPVADEEGFLIALPGATGETWRVARTQEENEAQVPWLSGFGADSFSAIGWEYGDEDARVIMAVLDAVVGEFAVDESRVYSMGVQNGSLMAARMVCDQADRFAALATMTNGLMMTDPCPANRAIPVIGTGGKENPRQREGLMEQGARLWAEHNGCEPEPSGSQIVEDVTELRWNGCEANASVVIHQIAGVSYEFVPGPVEQIGGYAPAQAIWRFLSEQALP